MLRSLKALAASGAMIVAASAPRVRMYVPRSA